MLKISELRKAYHGQMVLEIPGLEFPAGIHWLQGINGSGKTTLFRSIAGMLPFEGRILLDGKYEITKQAVDYRLRVNYGEAEPLYPAFLSANDLIQFVAKAKKASKEQISELIETLEISAFINNQTGTFSSGMLKKLSLVLAFLGQPSLILLDEPLITIDKAAVKNMYKLVNNYYKNGVSFIMSSHQDFELDDIHLSNKYLVKDKTVNLMSSTKNNG